MEQRSALMEEQIRTREARLKENPDFGNYAQEEGDAIKVNWGNLISLRDERNSLRLYNDILRYLENKNILTLSGQENSYFLMGHGINLNLNAGVIKFNFRRLEDALEYARIRYGDVFYDVQLAKIEKSCVNK